MLPPLREIRERRERYAARPKDLVEILHEGSRRARETARRTMDEVRSAVGLEP
jgi:tryptophanyl-tRNA synthetase